MKNDDLLVILFNKRNIRTMVFLAILLVFYVFLVKIVRPYFFYNYSNLKSLNFILGIIPNFIGALMLYLSYNFVLKFSKIRSAIFTLGLVLFMETERYFYEGKAFDIYDIIASIVAILILYGISIKNEKRLTE